MFFTNEQVQEYDKKKKEHPEFIQLSLLVASEQDGVHWLKNLINRKKLNIPRYSTRMDAGTSGLRKGDIIPELASFLEENFLKDDAGKWYQTRPGKRS